MVTLDWCFFATPGRGLGRGQAEVTRRASSLGRITGVDLCIDALQVLEVVVHGLAFFTREVTRRERNSRLHIGTIPLRSESQYRNGGKFVNPQWHLQL